MMRTKTNLLKVAKAYADARGLSLPRVSSIVFNDGQVLTRLEQGKNITIDRCDKAIDWFSANWPEKTKWPIRIHRPIVGARKSEGVQ